MDLPDARTLDSSTQEQIRLRAVHAVIEMGMTQQQAADLVGVSRQIVNTWVNIYKQRGPAGLRSHKRGRRPGHKKLLPWQAAQTAALLRYSPDELDLPFALWTREAVRTLIEQKFGVQLGLSTMGNYLARWGFTPQKPIHRALERDPVAVQAWLDTQYPAIQTRAKQEGALIWWADQVGFHSRDQVGRTYGLRGQTPVITATDKRFHCNAALALTHEGQMRFMVYEERMDADVWIRFLDRLVRSEAKARKIFLIVDRHSVHKSRKVKFWLAQNKEKIEQFYLPGYSPNLNPVEYVNNNLKGQSGVKKARIQDKPSLFARVRQYLRQIQRDTALLMSFFLAPDVQYTASG